MRELAMATWSLLRTPMAPRTRVGLAFGLQVVMFCVGAYAFAFGSVDIAVRFDSATMPGGTSYVIVSEVMPWSPLAAELRPGDAVISVNDVPLVPDFVVDRKPAPPVDGGGIPAGPIWSITTAPASELENWYATGTVPVHAQGHVTSQWLLDESGSAPLLGLAILVAGGLWLLSGGAGEALRRMAIPTVTAIAAPLLLVPAAFTSSAAGIVAVAVLLPLAQLPFADALVAEIDDPRRQGNARLFALGAAVVAVAAGLLALVGGPSAPQAVAQWVSAGAIAGIAGLMASRPTGLIGRAMGSASGRLAERLELAAVGITPFVAMIALVAPNAPPLIFPLALWLLALVAAQRFTVRPFSRIATRATLQRDLVVAATEAERARIAADLHDVAIQELTILARRLDARGDEEDAESARRVVEQLRTITGELRLPILDDLGVGPALEWLVGRMERLAGGEVRLERDDGSRLPPDVELALFRVAQEALANAVKHGRPPIVVRYRASASGATLTVDDAGPGIAAGAAEAAPAAGHFGLLGMQQRAEQIGALLDIRRWPTGGTHVGIEWRAP